MESLLNNQHTLLVFLSAAALPALAVTALALRRGLFAGKWKVFFMLMGLGLLLYTVFATFKEHGDELGWKDVLVGAITALITTYILARFSHGHKHEKEIGGARGIVVSEAFHSLIDGAVIGATYVVTPLLGFAATAGIFLHEGPKILGTVILFRSFGLSIKKTAFYVAASQIGAPIAALLVYMLGKRIDHEQFHLLEIASISSLAAIVLWIIYLEWDFHKRHPEAADGHGHDEETVHQH